MAPLPLLQNWSSCWHPTIAHYNGNGTTSTPPKLAVTLPPTIAHYNGTLQWHPAMAPRPLPQSSPPTIAHYNGTQQWHHVHSPKVGRRPPLPAPYHTTMAPSNGSTSTAPCNGTLVPLSGENQIYDNHKLKSSESIYDNNSWFQPIWKIFVKLDHFPK